MRYRPYILLTCLFAAGLSYAQAYKWVDAEGVVHYSDRPEPGAEVLELPEYSPTRSRPAARPNTTVSADTAASEEPDTGYQVLDIASPGPEETMWNIGSTLTVSLNLQPALKQGHQIRAYFDSIPMMVNSTSFQIPDIYRGAHNIQAEVLDATGQVQIRSRPHRFYIQQTSVTQRARTN